MNLAVKRVVVLVICSSFCLISLAQTGFGIGYNVGRFNTSMRNMEILTYEFNQDHPNYSQQYEFVNFYRGFTAMTYKDNYRFGADVGQEFRFSNRVITATAIGADNPGDTIYKRRVRVAVNTLSWGWYFKPHKNIRLGVDWDLVSRCTFSKKIGPEDDFRNQKRTSIYIKRGFLTFGFTAFADFRIGAFYIRPYYQVDVIPGRMEFGYNTYSFKTANIGISVCVGSESSD